MGPSLRDRALRGARGVVRRAARPTLTVVVEARGREADVRASIDSARDQAGRQLEILLVVTEARLTPLAEEAAAGDWRVRVVEALGAGPAEARRAGGEAARGDRLLFLPGRQELLPGSVATLERRTSEVVVGRGECPVLGRLLASRALWQVTEDDDEPAGQTLALRLLAAPHDTVPVPTLRDRGVLRPRPFEPQVDPLPALAARVAHDETMLGLAEGLDVLDRRTCAAGILGRDLVPFLDAVERCDDEQWTRLHRHTAALVREAGSALADVPVEDRVLAWLVSEGRREESVAYVASRRFTRGQFPTEVRGGLIRAGLDVRGVPDHVLAVTEAQSPLRVRVSSYDDDGVVLWAAIQRLGEETPAVSITLDGRSLDVELSEDPGVTRWMGEAHQRHDSGVIRARWSPASAESAGPSDLEIWGGGRDLEIEVVDRGVRRRSAVEMDEAWADPPAGKPAALADDEAGPYRQRLLQEHYAKVTEPVDPCLVYFQTYLGQAATDHPGAIQAALQRVRPAGLRMLWGVADADVPVPDGAEPVVLRSRQWYDAMARAAYVVTNVELEPWFVRREGQEVLETYHGYPSKAMGLGQWRARDLTPTHVAEMLRRTSGTWNNLLTPIPEMDRYYRESYAFEGRIISQGYPRDDSLVAEGHEQRRRDTRRQLGIGEHQQAVLYAPTWRDDLATSFRSAEAVLHLDVGRAARDLGPDYVMLMRGHRFHAPTAGGAQVVDVTSHPEVNDLLLAGDVAVLDYSSMRFDFALTGKPMVFLVPDLHAYTEQTRGFLYPFTDSAPGPLVEDTEEVVALLRDLPALKREWAPRLAAFNARYQPLSDGHAADRVVAEFFAPLLEGRR